MSDVSSRQHICPDCCSGSIQHVRRPGGAFDYIARLLGWRFYRCLDCGAYFYDRPLHRKAS
jgi:hypothetical protein